MKPPIYDYASSWFLAIIGLAVLTAVVSIPVKYLFGPRGLDILWLTGLSIMLATGICGLVYLTRISVSLQKRKE